MEEEEGQKIVQPEHNNAPSHAWNHLPDHLHMKEINTESSENNSDYSNKLRILERNCLRINKQLNDVKNILERMQRTTEHKDTEAAEIRAIVREWRLVALAVDRFLFLLYLISIILSLMYMFPRPPNWTMIYIDLKQMAYCASVTKFQYKSNEKSLIVRYTVWMK